MLVENIKTTILRIISLPMRVNYSTNTAKKQLDLVTAFYKDAGMIFEAEKCAYQQTQNGKLLLCTNNLEAKINYR